MENKSVILNKFETIEKCINRINEDYENDSNNLNDYRKNDAIVLNLQRACQATIDIAMYIVSNEKLGMPHTNKDAFEMLYENNYIDKQTLENMKGMIGFRNIAVHTYQEIDDEILQDVIENHLNDLIDFARKMLNKNI